MFTLFASLFYWFSFSFILNPSPHPWLVAVGWSVDRLGEQREPALTRTFYGMDVLRL
jgi:hypothetical protein